MKIDSQSTHLPSQGYIDQVINPTIDHWSHFRCGSYTSEWVAQAIGIQNKTSNSILPGPVWFDLFRPITPGDMRKLFKSKGMTTVQICLEEFSAEDRLNWIRSEIVVFRRPPVLLIRTATLHWIAIGGYDDQKKLFYIYDARIGSNSVNLNLPIGNNTISYDELLLLWRGRLFMNYIAIVVAHVHAYDLRKDKVKKIIDTYTNGDLIHRDPKIENKSWSLDKGVINIAND